MKIEVLNTFLDGMERFEAGDIRTVDDERGARFVANGWAKDTAGRVATGTTTDNADLSIQNSIIGLGDNHG